MFDGGRRLVRAVKQKLGLMEEVPVNVYIYDLSKGLARSVSRSLLGRQIDGIWHTGIVVYGEEYYFGGDGINSCDPGGTILGRPDSIVEVGKTQIPKEIFMEYLQELSQTTFRGEKYHLLEHNCNTFSDEVAHFLTNKGIPSHITNLPQDVLSTPFGAMIKPFIDAMTVQPSGGHQVFGSTAGATGGSSNQHKKSSSANNHNSAETSLAFQHMTFRKENKKILESWKTLRPSFNKSISEREQGLLDEAIEYAQNNPDDLQWALGMTHIKFYGDFVGDAALPVEQRLLVANLFEEIALRDDFAYLVLSDLETNLLKLLASMDSMDDRIQCSLIRTASNVCGSEPGYDWFMGMNENRFSGERKTNREFITQLCSKCLKHSHERIAMNSLQLAHNLTSRLLPSVIAKDLGMATVDLCQQKQGTKEMYEFALPTILSCMKSTTDVVAYVKKSGMDFTKIQSEGGRTEEICRRIQDMLKV